jgi:threonine dehydratase
VFPALCTRKAHDKKCNFASTDWTQWLTHLLKITVEPTSAMAAAAAVRYLRDLPPPSTTASNTSLSVPKKTCLIVLSGGNLSTETRQQIWSEDYLAHPPEL